MLWFGILWFGTTNSGQASASMNSVSAKVNDLATQHGLRLEILQSCAGLLVSV